MNSDIKEISGLFAQWNAALQSGDPHQVVQQYAPDAILLPTVSPVVRHNHNEIRDYFEKLFLPLQPSGTILESNIRCFGEIAIHSGIYAFSLKNQDQPVPARFTFVYHRKNGVWKIVEHHSSGMPTPRSGENS